MKISDGIFSLCDIYIKTVIFHVYHLIVYACFYTNHIIYMYMRF